MKKWLLISAGALVILLALGVWVYLIVFGVPDSPDDVFANFNIGTATEPTPVQPSAPEPEPRAQVDVADEQALKQLTTRPVAGFVYISNGTGTSTRERAVRYAERGTGHIYEIDLESGEETRLSGTTIAKTTDAVFSPDGGQVALTSAYGADRSTFVGTLEDTGDGSINGNTLPRGADDIHIDGDDVVWYRVLTPDGSRLERRNLVTGSSDTVASIPLSAVTVIWSPDGSVPHHLYNRPHANYKGALYTLENGSLSGVGASGFGLIALTSEQFIVRTLNNDGELESTASFQENLSDTIALGITAIPEKCSFSATSANILYCGNELPSGSLPVDYVTDWYAGAFAAEDSLWRVSLTSGSAVLLTTPQRVVGRSIDVHKLHASGDGQALLFTNRRDDTLWLYDLAQ